MKVCSDDVKRLTALILRVSESSVMGVSVLSNFEYLKLNSLKIAVVQDFQSFRKFGLKCHIWAYGLSQSALAS
jgi:hypothetical protein